MVPYRLDVVTLAPQAFAPLGELGVIGRAFNAGRAELVLHNPRVYASDRYRKVDDEPYGGGAQRWSTDHDQLVLLCGHYEGFDERIRSLADEEVSLGDFVLTGGELPAMTIINGVVRLLPGTVGSAESLVEESHSDGLLEHPHYTRPAEFRGMGVPEVLRSGDHGAVARWRQQQREQRTAARRPDLMKRWQQRFGADNESENRA
jgi:tRNA G37 N-methylase TrmD